MEKDLLISLLATLPIDRRKTSEKSLPENRAATDYLLIRGYRVPFASPVDNVMLGLLADFRRSEVSGESLSGIDRG